MTNGDIAEAFETIGKILELQDANPFRIRAYARAAQTIANLSRGLSDVYDEGGLPALQEIPGIGKDLSLKIEELLTTGKLAYLEELSAAVPTGLLEMMEIEGLGPKRTRIIYEQFGVSDIPGLEALVASGKLAELKGWGETSAKNVLRGIETRKTLHERLPIHRALPVARSIVELLRESGLCGRVEIAGSLRRRKETIGDIDILATSEKVPEVMELFCAMPMVRHVLAKGETKSSVNLKLGLDADLRVVDEDVFGAALYYFTGSKEHNVHVRSLAVRKGITINEYGVFKGTAREKGTLMASRTEEDVFDAVGLPYVPPEMREDWGEVALALEGKLPRLIEEGDLKGDLHVHSDFSDGSASMEEMAAAAKAKGLEYIAVTDHASAMGMVKGIKEENIGDYLRRIEAARAKVPGIRILAGAEVDIEDDGSLYLPDSALKQLDWVVASVHGKFRQTREEMTARIVRAIENPFVRVLGHPTARLLGKRPPVEADMEKVLRAAKGAGVAVELNASPERLDLNDIHCKRAKELGVKIAIDSDAHHPKDLDCAVGVSQARRGWVEAADVLNALPWAAFEKLLLKRRS